MYDYIVIGCGFAGATIAERLANKSNKKVLIIDKRNTIGGNMYDYVDENEILIHKYGPHLFHTNIEEVYNYIKQFDELYLYEHKVLGKVNNIIVPIPFNINSIRKSFSKNKADKLISILENEFGKDKKIPILELKNYDDDDIKQLAEFIYENVFLYYTLKQWGQKPDEIDPNVTSRVPVYISEDNRYFQDEFQFMPKNGYTKLIENMLSSDNIDIKLNTDSKEVLKIIDNKIYFENQEFLGKVIYTGAIDELFNYEYGDLPYRSLRFELETINKPYYQEVGTVNYPTQEDKFTRITEFKHMTLQNPNTDKTTIMREYPCEYKKDENIPYYPIVNNNNLELYNKYLNRAKKVKNLYLIGRLAQYKYFNMDLVIKEALELYKQLEETNEK